MKSGQNIKIWNNIGTVRRYNRAFYFGRTGMPLSVFMLKGEEAEGLVHYHDFTELVIVLSGSGMHLTSPEPYLIQAGDVFVVHENTRHAYHNTGSLHHVNVLFDLKQLHLPVKDLNDLEGYQALFMLEPRLRSSGGAHHHCRLSDSDLTIAHELLTNIMNELKQQAVGYRSMAAGLFLQLIGFLSRCYSHIRDPEPRALLRLGQAMNYMENHYTEQITLAGLARKTGMSPSTLQRIFQSSFQTSPIDYLIGLRIQKSLPMLLEKELNITETAFNVGFTDSNYFTRQFRKRMGMSPREYWRQASEK